MSGRMNWARARLHGRRTTDHRYEHELPDRAQRWLEAVERNRRARRRNQQHGQYSMDLRRNISATAGSTEAPLGNAY
jgi:hypothetical protein